MNRTNGQGETFDFLSYNYDISLNNQLRQVTDEGGDTNAASNDFDNYERYEYDEIGNLIYLEGNGETSRMTWTIYGKLATVEKQNWQHNLEIIITYTYDAMGNRVRKEVSKHNNSGWGGGNANYQTTYWRDAQGNVLKTQTTGSATDLNGTTQSKNSEEFVIYGSSRLGTYSPVYNEYVNQFFGITANSLTLGYKAYELSNHLGNVLTTISDNYFAQNSTAEVAARVLSSQDYFPFGMVMTERSFQEKQERKYRFGFNGKEEDFDMSEGVLNFEARGMDSRTCRFTSVDPLAAKYPNISPFVFVANCPLIFVDLQGKIIAEPKTDRQKAELEIVRSWYLQTNKGRELWQKMEADSRNFNFYIVTENDNPDNDLDIGFAIADGMDEQAAFDMLLTDYGKLYLYDNESSGYCLYGNVFSNNRIKGIAYELDENTGNTTRFNDNGTVHIVFNEDVLDEFNALIQNQDILQKGRRINTSVHEATHAVEQSNYDIFEIGIEWNHKTELPTYYKKGVKPYQQRNSEKEAFKAGDAAEKEWRTGQEIIYNTTG